MSPRPERPGNPTLFRAAALTLATTQEHAACPVELTWLDLRSTAEVVADRFDDLPQGWVHCHVPMAEPEDISDAEMRRHLERYMNGEATPGEGYVDMLDTAAEGIVAALRALARIDGAIAVTCQGGRDRTGVLVALILSLLDAPREWIVADYLRTNDDLDENLRRQPPRAMYGAVGLDLTCHAAPMEQMLDHLAELGGARGYLSRLMTSREVDEVALALTDRTSRHAPQHLLPERSQTDHEERFSS